MYPSSVLIEGKRYIQKQNPLIGYHFTLRDWERDDFTGEIMRPNLPCVFRCGEIENTLNGHYTPLNEEWQFFMLNLLSLSFYMATWNNLTIPEYDWLADRYKGLYADNTAFTNKHGTTTHRNYVTRKADDMNKDAEDMKIYTLICGGASLRGSLAVNSKGEKIIKVDCFDGNQPPPNINTINIHTDERIFFATTITNTPSGEGYKVNKFPYLKDATGYVYDCPIPLIASMPIYYPIKDLSFYTGAVKKRPYYP